MVVETQISERVESKSTRVDSLDLTHLMPTTTEMQAFQNFQNHGMSVAEREQAMFGNGFTFASNAGDIYGGQSSAVSKFGAEDLIAQANLKNKGDSNVEEPKKQNHDVSAIDWVSHSGDTLARMVAKLTDNGGLMVLGPGDTMRGEAEKYEDPDGYFPVFTHASPTDLHMYLGVHNGKKQYSVKALAELIKEHVKPGQPIRLLGCEAGVDGGIARELAKLLPDNPVYAPNGFCQLKDGVATVYKQKPSEVPFGEEPQRGEFVRVKPN